MCTNSVTSDEDMRDSRSLNKPIDLFSFISTDLARIHQIIASLYVFYDRQSSTGVRGICITHYVCISIGYMQIICTYFRIYLNTLKTVWSNTIHIF